MNHEPAVLDTDTLSELSRGNPHVRGQALVYLNDFGRLTITAVTVFERLRGYRVAIRDGKPFERQMEAFEALVANCIVLPFDEEAARVAAEIWSAVAHRSECRRGADDDSPRWQYPASFLDRINRLSLPGLRDSPGRWCRRWR